VTTTSEAASASAYCYPGTDVVINKWDIRDARELQARETLVTAAALQALEARPVAGVFDLPHLRTIHRRICGEVYPFAGELRTETIGRPGPFGDSGDAMHWFAPPDLFPRYEELIFGSLAADDRLRGCTTSAEFAERGARYAAAANFHHPFRDVNGRALREFMRELALNAGFDLDWTRVDRPTYLTATVMAWPTDDDLGDTRYMARVLETCTTNKEQRLDLQRSWDALGKGRDR
jgi:cell filamentation protein